MSTEISPLLRERIKVGVQIYLARRSNVYNAVEELGGWETLPYDLRLAVAEMLASWGQNIQDINTHAARSSSPRVAGRCPSCDGWTLFLGERGHVTCSFLECKEPHAANDLLKAGRW